MRNIICSALLAAFASASAMAEQGPTDINLTRPSYDFPACADHRGEAVRYIDNATIEVKPHIAFIGVRYLEENPLSFPAIIYKTEFLDQLSPFAFDFTMAHECFHLHSGDAFSAYRHYQETGRFQSRRELQQFEDDADCYAAQTMIRHKGYKYENVEEGLNAPETFGGRLDMSDRVPLILECARNVGQRAAGFNPKPFPSG